MKKKLFYVVSDIAHSAQFECTALGLAHQFELTFIFIGSPQTPFQKFLQENNIEVYFLNAKTNRLPVLWLKVFRIFILRRPDIVHAHLWHATLIAITSSWVLRIPRRIFTRHHGTQHYTLYPSGRKWDRLCNALATDIVAVSQNVMNILVKMDKASRKKISLIRHGFYLDLFQETNSGRSRFLADKYNIPLHAKKIGVISRYTEWKGVQYIIEAFNHLRATIPDVHLILTNAIGDYHEQIREKLAQLPEGSYTEIEFEKDISSLYSLFDVFVHVPINEHVEAFGQIYIEAMAAGRPCVFTLSGIATEIVQHEKNALVVPYRDSAAIAREVTRLLQNDSLAKDLCRRAVSSVSEFHINNMIGKLHDLYA